MTFHTGPDDEDQGAIGLDPANLSGRSAAPALAGIEARIRIVERADHALTSAVLTAAARALQLGDTAKLTRILQRARRRTEDGEGPAYMMAAFWDVHLDRAALIVNGEGDQLRWQEDPHANPCPNGCQAGKGVACFWPLPRSKR